MMTIAFVSNDKTDLTGGFTETSSYRRTTNVTKAFGTSGDWSGPDNYVIYDIVPVAGDETWIHAQVAFGGSPIVPGGSGSGQIYCAVRDEQGIAIVAFYQLSGGVRMSVYGETTETYLKESWIHGGSNIKAVDIHIDMSGGNIRVKAYVGAIDSDAVPIWDVTAVNSSTPRTAPFQVSWSNGDLGATGTFWQYVSELICADEDTRGWGLSNLLTYAAGDHTDWAGDVASLSDQNDGTGMNSEAIGDKVSQDVVTYTGPASAAVRAVVLTTRVSAVGFDVKQMLRKGTTDYLGSALGLGEGFAHRFTEWEQNPDTAANWDTADLTGFEFGLQTVA